MPRVAIPLPPSSDREYAQRAIPQYEEAITQAGGEPIRIPLDQPQNETKKLIATCDAILLPGSKADVDPAKFHAPPSPQAHPRHLLRTAEPQRLPLRLPDPTHPRFSSRRLTRPRRPRSGKETSHRSRCRNREQFEPGRNPT